MNHSNLEDDAFEILLNPLATQPLAGNLSHLTLDMENNRLSDRCLTAMFALLCECHHLHRLSVLFRGNPMAFPLGHLLSSCMACPQLRCLCISTGVGLRDADMIDLLDHPTGWMHACHLQTLELGLSGSSLTTTGLITLAFALVRLPCNLTSLRIDVRGTHVENARKARTMTGDCLNLKQRVSE